MSDEPISSRWEEETMQTSLLDLKHSKTSSASLIMILLILTSMTVMLTFSTANGSAPEIKAPTLTTIPTIDGNWGANEWDDAFEYTVTNASRTSYVRVKYGAGNVSGTFLYMIIDSQWDTTPPSVYTSENTWLAFDTLHNHGSAPQIDDYLFNLDASYWMGPAWQGDGTKWTTIISHLEAGYMGTTSMSSGHRVSEVRIPSVYVGTANQTSGFYFMLIDDINDPDGTGPLGSPTYVEWPENSGGRSDGWPPEGRDPCPTPSAWGHLTFLQRPTASFTYSPDVPDVNETVTFDASASQDPDGSIVNYAWDFGDGNVTTVNTPVITHTFMVGGGYYVNLTVTDDTGLNASVVHTITVGVRAAFTFSPTAPNPGDVVTFDATASYSRGGTIVNYTWNFNYTGNWGETISNVTTNPIITHTFMVGGGYYVNLTVTDDTGLNASVVHTVYVGAPRANFTLWPSAPNSGDVVTFDASASQDPDGSIVNCTWDFDDGKVTTVNATTMTHTFSTAGNYNVTLTVTDNLGLNDSFAHIVTVYALRKAHFSFSPSTPNVGDAVTFNASLSKDPGGAIANYTWDFNDGNITMVDAPTDTIIHIFSTNGSYNVNLTITDDDGLKSWYTNTVNVEIPPVQATVPFSPIIPTIDGNWTGTEWDDANEYILDGLGGEGYMLVKWGPGNITGDFLYILIDSPWDTTNATAVGFENAFVAFDTEHDKSTVGPQTDDYLFNDGYSQWILAWQGNGTMWIRTEINYTGMGYMATRWSSSSPKNATMHRIDEFRIPLAFVGNSTSGFYVIVIDSASDPDGWGLNQPPTAWVEWPAGVEGDPRGWPVPPDYIDPCSTPDKWGYLILEPPMKALSNITLDISSSSITLGESVTISGTVSNSTGPIAWVNVTIQYRLTGATGWTNIATITTSSTGSYAYAWKPTEAGTYEIKASWAGDANNYGAESEVKTLKATSKPIPILEIAAVLAVVAVVVAIAVYLLKVRKPKR